ncbi:MAG: hypothetical protein JWR37_4477 [Mycobacterium sp.]|nr:hypothetical protein [Mycobacterium sp.]
MTSTATSTRAVSPTQHCDGPSQQPRLDDLEAVIEKAQRANQPAFSHPNGVKSRHPV